MMKDYDYTPDEALDDLYYSDYKSAMKGSTSRNTEQSFMKELMKDFGPVPKGINKIGARAFMFQPDTIEKVQFQFSGRGVNVYATMDQQKDGGRIKLVEYFNHNEKTLFEIRKIPDDLFTAAGAKKWIKAISDGRDSIVKAYRERIQLDNWAQRYYFGRLHDLPWTIMTPKEFHDRVLQKGAAAYRASHPIDGEQQMKYLMSFGPPPKGCQFWARWSEQEKAIVSAGIEIDRYNREVRRTWSSSAVIYNENGKMEMLLRLRPETMDSNFMYRVTDIPGDVKNPADAQKWLGYVARHSIEIRRAYDERFPADYEYLKRFDRSQRDNVEPPGSVITAKQFMEMFPRRDYEEPMLKEDERAQEAVRTQELSADKEIATQTDAKAPDAQEMAPTDPLDNFLVDDRAEEPAEQQKEQEKDERLAKEQQEERR